MKTQKEKIIVQGGSPCWVQDLERVSVEGGENEEEGGAGCGLRDTELCVGPEALASQAL